MVEVTKIRARIGYYTEVLMKTKIRDINRFVFPERLCNYAGLVPSTDDLGKTVWHGGITQEGSRWLRWVLVEAAQTHVHKYDTSITLACNRIAEKKGKKIASVAAARRLLMVSHSVLKSRKPFYDQA